MERLLFIIGCNYPNIPGLAPLNVGPDMANIGGFFQHTVGYRLIIVQDKSRDVVIESLQEQLKILKPGDTLIIYFGGHGVETTHQLLILPLGGKDSAVATDPAEAAFDFLEVAELRRQTTRRGLTVALILDSCRNGDARSEHIALAAAQYTRRMKPAAQAQAVGASRDIGFKPTLPTLPPLPPLPGSGNGPLSIFSACSPGELAPELGKGGNGLFSTAMLNILGASHKAGRRVCLDDELCADIKTEMNRLSREFGVEYEPTPYREGDGTPELFAARRRIRPVAAIALLLAFVVLPATLIAAFRGARPSPSAGSALPAAFAISSESKPSVGPSATTLPTPAKPDDSERHTIAGLGPDEFILHLKTTAPLDQLSYSSNASQSGVRIIGSVLNNQELQFLADRYSAAGSRVSLVEVKVNASEVAARVQTKLRGADPSASVRATPQTDGLSGLFIEYNSSPKFSREDVKKMCSRFVLNDARLTIREY